MTREFACDICHVAKGLARDIVKYRSNLAGVKPEKFEMAHIDAIFGTPGRLLDKERRGWLDLKLCTFVVLDDCDSLMSRGFDEILQELLAGVDRPVVCALDSVDVPVIEAMLKPFAPKRIVEPCPALPSWCVMVEEERWKVREARAQ
jgi:superfamily II DNA/RNA helicase